MSNIKAISVINNYNAGKDNSKFSEEDLSSLLSLVNSMPGVAYWKSITGVYLWHNDFTEDHEIIFKLPNDTRNIVGKTDYDIFPYHIADEYRRNDLEAMVSKNGIATEEVFYDKYNIKHLMFFYKRPMLDKLDKFIGIISNVINITNFDNQNNNLNIKKINESFDITILKPLKEIMLLLNLIETTCETNNVLSLLSEINGVVKHIFDNCNKQKNNIIEYV